LPLSITGVPLHTRSLTCVASLRQDGRWDFRGDVIDLRKSGFVPMTQDIQPTGIIHHMTIALVIDPATQRIDELSTAQPHVAVEASDRTSGECCRDPAHRLLSLKGEVIDDGFTKKLSANFGGALGCSHLLTLFFAMAAALPRAIAREAEIVDRYREARAPGEKLFWRSVFIDGYEVEDGSIELSSQLADVHSHPHHAVSSPLDRLDRQEEARVVARVEPPGFSLSKLRAERRTRVMPNLADARWEEANTGLDSLIGLPIVPGLSRKVRDLYRDDASSALVRDALLQLAPGHIQVLAAITDRWFTKRHSEANSENSGDPTRAPGPPIGAIGGMVDSCYMWRKASPLIQARENMSLDRSNARDDESS
jgi:hypothetical protein